MTESPENKNVLPCQCPGGKILSFLEIVSIAEVQRDQQIVAERYFTPDELAAIAEKRIQTLAGFLATKRSLVALFSAIVPQGRFSERDFVLSHHDNGAPRLESSPDILPGQKVRISISHTRKWAYGLSVYQEENCA